MTGIYTELTNSDSQNFRLISSLWKEFNAQLPQVGYKGGTNWQKFGITAQKNNRLFYYTAVPQNTVRIPFREFEIPAFNYLRFTNIGAMGKLARTLDLIYTEEIPTRGIELDPNRTIIHIERYSNTFKWNAADSQIEIFIPVEL